MLIGFAFPLFAYAEACTYNEAVIAYKQDNATRGAALMNMAAKDGDQRAVKYLANIQQPDKAPVIKAYSQIAFVNK